MNICSFTGRLTATPELKATLNGKNVCSFTLAVERRFKGADGKPVVDFVDFVAWEHNATFICKWFDKGVRMAVTGELQTRRYEKDGQAHKITEVLVSTVEFADGKREANTVSKPDDNTFANTTDDFIPLDAGDTDLPF